MNSQEILDALEFQPTCAFAHPGEYGHPLNQPCERPATWSVKYHACPQSTRGDSGTGTTTWCNHHLQIFSIGINTAFDDNQGRRMCCACGHLYNTPSDFFWDVTPLNTRSNH